jgi:hypothetical protein
MRSLEDVFEELEGDYSSRESEVKLLQRLLSSMTSHDERAMVKRSLILLCYAHLEGFCKFALFAYVSSLNSMNLRCSEASYPIAAASLSKVFAALRDPSSKHDSFRRSLPDDTALHLSAREQIFIESFHLIDDHRIEILDSVIDTKSNLSPAVLKKLLFQIGLDYLSVDIHQSHINRLLGIRNAIAHGDRLKVPGDSELEDCLAAAFGVMRFLQNEIFVALKDKVYLRDRLSKAPEYVTSPTK